MVKPDEYWTLVEEKLVVTPSRQKKLDTLKAYLISSWAFTEDPIIFIQTHYDGDKKKWIQQKDLIGLWKLLKNKWMDYATPDGLHKFLVVLGIKFRPNTEKTVWWKESLLQNTRNKITMSENLERFNNAILNLLPENISPIEVHFDSTYYASLRNTIDKVVYLLQIQKEDIWSISLAAKLKWQALMTAINTRLWEITRNLRNQGFDIEDLTVSKWSINNLLSKLNSKN